MARPIWPFGRSEQRARADALVALVSQVSRQPAFYGPDRTPDTLEGRLELLMLHGALLLIRLRDAPELGPLAQSFTDRLFRHIDAGLREDGVGDLSVPRRMRRIAGQFYGRLEAYAAALAADEPEELAAAIARNMPGEAGANYAPRLAAYVRAVHLKHAGAPPERAFELAAWAGAPE